MVKLSDCYFPGMIARTMLCLRWKPAVIAFACCAVSSGQSLVFPPYLHSYGIRKATPAHLFMFFGPRTFFDDPQGLATAKMISRDKPDTESDDDEVVVYGVNAGRHQIIYNVSMWALALYGSEGSGKDRLKSPKGIACDPQGNVYIADAGNNRIVHLFNAQREVAWVKAFGVSPPGQLRAPSQVALDEKGKIYVTDTGNRRVIVFDSSGAVVRAIPDAKNGPMFIDGPEAIAVADGLNYWSFYKKERCIFCADSAGRRVWKMSLDGKVLKKIVLPGAYSANYAAIDYYHNLWITDKKSHCVLKFDHDLKHLDTFGSKGKEDNQFIEPRGIAIWKRYGQTFIAEKAGAQYYWIGTKLNKYELKPAGRPLQYSLATVATEYSYVSIFRCAGADTAFLMKKRFVYPGVQTTHFIASGGDSVAGSALTLRIEPTYSSYTYRADYFPLTLKRKD